MVGVPDIYFLEHPVSVAGIEPLRGRVSVIKDFPVPKTLTQL